MPFMLTTDGATALAPINVCNTPAPPAGTIPIPYPSIGSTKDAKESSQKVSIVGNPALHTGHKISRTKGDEAGTGGGLVSHKNSAEAQFLMGSIKVKVEGKPAALQTAPTGQNLSPPNAPGSVQTPSQTKVSAGA